MRRFIITSPKFTGEINVLYGLDNKLQFIDFMKCDLTEEQTTFFKNRLPVFYTETFLESFGTSRLDVVEEGYRVTFDQWWTRYDLKRNRDRCLKMWNKLTEADQVNAFFKLNMYERHLSLNAWKTKAEPETYLRKRYWDSDWSKN
jgi:hypothetical protein